MAKKLNLVVRQGETFIRVIRPETAPFIYKAITGISKTAPVNILSVGHGLASGWRVAVVSVQGMKQINARNNPLRDSDFQQVTVVDVDNITLNKVNSAEYDAYVSGGYLQFYSPLDLSGYLARMTIKNRIGGTVLATLTSGAPDNRITIDDTNHTVTLTIAATDTEDFGFTSGVYDLELVAPTGVVTTLYFGTIQIKREVTT